MSQVILDERTFLATMCHFDANWSNMNKKEFRPEEVVGKPYEHGMLPYGGGVSMKTGRVAFATSHEEHEEIMAKLRSFE